MSTVTPQIDFGHDAEHCCLIFEMNPKRCSKYGGRSAIGKEKHMEARYAIRPIFDNMAVSFDIPCEFFPDFEIDEADSPITGDSLISALFKDVETENFVSEGRRCRYRFGSV